MNGNPPETPTLEAVLNAVREQHGGQTEHALLSRLRAEDVAPFADADLSDPMELFRVHFLLFNALYRLQKQLAGNGEWLRIHCLDIGLSDLSCTPCAGGTALTDGDPLREYYLDLTNLDRMDAATLEAMLSGFWRQFSNTDRRLKALEVLGLEEPATSDLVKRRYRQLAQQHHPDKGGDTETLQRLNEARLILTTG